VNLYYTLALDAGTLVQIGGRLSRDASLVERRLEIPPCVVVLTPP